MQLPQGRVGIAQQPEHDGRPAPATHARVVPIEDGQRAVLLEVVEREALLRWARARRSSPVRRLVVQSAWWASSRRDESSPCCAS